MTKMFLTSSANQVLDRIVELLPQSPDQYKVAFIDTAAETSSGEHWWVTADKDKLLALGFQLDAFSLTGMNRKQLENKLMDKQIIFLCGGSTYYLYDQIQKNNLDKVIIDRVKAGLIYIGSSAGSMVAGNNFDIMPVEEEKKDAPNLKSFGLALTNINVIPHWGSSDFADDYKKGFPSMYREGEIILPLTNSQFVYLENDRCLIVDVT